MSKDNDTNKGVDGGMEWRIASIAGVMADLDPNSLARILALGVNIQQTREKEDAEQKLFILQEVNYTLDRIILMLEIDNKYLPEAVNVRLQGIQAKTASLYSDIDNGMYK